MGGPHITIPCTISKQGTAFQVQALIDSGANGYAFIDEALLRQISSVFTIFVAKLPAPIPVKGYNGTAGKQITHYTRFTLTIDKRIQSYTPFLITTLQNNGIILGRQWLAEHSLLLDCKKQKLLWPRSYPPTLSFASNRILSWEDLKPKPLDSAMQLDAERRDRKLDQYWKRRKSPILNNIHYSSHLISQVNSDYEITLSDNSTESNISPDIQALEVPPQESSKVLKPLKENFEKTSKEISSILTTTGNTFKKSITRSIKRMNEILKDLSYEVLKNNSPIPIPRKRRFSTPHSSDSSKAPNRIALITGPAFHLTCIRRQNDELFISSFHEISELIDQRSKEERSTKLVDTALQDLRSSLLQRRTAAHSLLASLSALDAEPSIPPEYEDYADVFSKAESDILPPHRLYDHKITLEGDGEKALKYSPLYKMSLEELETVKKYITDNLHKGFIEPSQAPFAAPILFVRKADGSLRLCIDFRVLNSLTRKDRYPLPLIDEILGRLTDAKIFTKLDIRQAFHRIRMDPQSEEYTTFRTRYGAYKCRVLPFGLTNGPATYQRYMNDVLFDYLDDFCTAYLDDILIYSSDPLEHQIHVKKVLQRLRDAGLQADLKKSEFSITRTKYLGFIISTEGVEVDPEKVAVIRNWAYPTTVKGIQSFLGFCNFYRRFIRNFGILAKPLINLTKNNVPFRFDDDCIRAFDALKDSLTSSPVLQHYRQDLECMLETDASDGVVASVLSQKHGENWLPVGFYSKTMAPAELNYEVHDKEMLSIVKSFGYWRAELTSTPHQIRVYTDHKALVYFMTTKALNSRQARWAELLADYNFVISYRPGKDNPLADALTRRTDELDDQNQKKKLQRHQQLLKDDQIDPLILSRELRPDPAEEALIRTLDLASIFPALRIIDRILLANRYTPSLEALRKQAQKDDNHFSLEDGLLLYKDKLVVPDTDNLRTLLIREAHDNISTAHPGIRKTLKLLTDRYYWRGISQTVAQYCRNCNTCRRINVPRDKTPGLLHPLPIPSRPWEHITMDYCSFNKDKYGYDNVFVIIDRFSKQAISIPCKKAIDSITAAKLYIYHIYRYFGPPLSIISDRGSQFISSFWKEFQKILGTNTSYSTTDHPQTDGQTEIYNQYLQKRLRPFVSYYQDNWSELLPMMDYAQLILPHDSLGGISPFEVVHGYPPRTSWDWKSHNTETKDKLSVDEARIVAQRHHDAWKLATKHLTDAQERAQLKTNAHRRPVDFKVGDYVWLDMRYYRTERPSKKLDFPINGKFLIVEKVGHSFKLALPDTMKIFDTFPAEKLRKAANDPLPGQVNDPDPPINITGEEEWEIEQIIASKRTHNSIYYRVQWRNYDVDLTWYAADNFKYSPHKLKEYHLANQDLPGPPKALPQWLKHYEDGDDEYDDVVGDKEMDKRSRASFFQTGG